jgi:hypothetical protein
LLLWAWDHNREAEELHKRHCPQFPLRRHKLQFIYKYYSSETTLKSKIAHTHGSVVV